VGSERLDEALTPRAPDWPLAPAARQVGGERADSPIYREQKAGLPALQAFADWPQLEALVKSIRQ
jgi:hypothetical protein